MFAALYPPPAVQAQVTERVAAALAGAALGAVRPVPAHQLHLTLAFYGEVAEAAVPDLLERLRRVALRSAPVTLALHGAGAFPRPARANVVWVGVSEPTGQVRRIADRAVAAGRRAGLRLDRPRWRAHLSVARLSRPADVRHLVDVLDGAWSATWRAAELVVVHSSLGAVLRHEPVARLPFGGYQA